jgi:hypothetical protein
MLARTDNTITKNVEDMFLWKTVDATMEPEEESARRWDMGRNPEHVEVHGPSVSESGGGGGSEPGCSLFGGEESGQHPAKTEQLVHSQEWPTPELCSPYFSAMDVLTPKSTFSTPKLGF